MTITINEPLQYTLTANDSTVCAGTMVTLSVNIQPSYPAGTIHCNGIPTEVVDVTNPVTGKTWMDRNLGASRAATSSTDSQAYGDLYQWGRGADGHQCRNSATTSILSSSDQPGHGDFIVASDYWCSQQSTNLWQGVNGINNPCPNGYRLPTQIELNMEVSSWVSTNTIGAYTSPLKLPMSGYRIFLDGSNYSLNSAGVYASSIVTDASNQINLYFNNTDAGVNGSEVANGLSIRCIKD
jgi:uncharacterized protein (TIGR02145 family)